MRQIIKDVLNIHGEMNVNLASDAARDVIAIEIIEKLKKKGFYTEYRKDELEKREAKKGWVCQTCGKSTFETEYDYLVHPKLHLGCALKEEMDGNDIKEQYHKASSQLFKEGKRESVKYSSKGPEYDSRENPSIPYLPGKHTEIELEKQKRPAFPEAKNYCSKKAWICSICGKNTYDVDWDYIGSNTNHLECELENEMKNKLSEEIVDNKDIKYIYESPDGGKTIYRREFGSDEKELVKNG